MPAEEFTDGVRIATLDGKKFPTEKDPQDLKQHLSNVYDVHFGLNKNMTLVADPHLWDLGPRALDIVRRGGRTAEDSWRHLGYGQIFLYCRGPKTHCPGQKGWVCRNPVDKKPYIDLFNNKASRNISGSKVYLRNGCPGCKGKVEMVGLHPDRPFHDSFDVYVKDLDKAKPIKTLKNGGKHGSLFPKGARKDGQKIQNRRKGYAQGAKFKTEFPRDDSRQYGVRWSKAALEWVATNQDSHASIHFHLDGLGNLSDLVHKKAKKTDPYKGGFAYNVTARELRYVWRNWNRFKKRVHFYNGYAKERGQLVVVEVKCPWEDKNWPKTVKV